MTITPINQQISNHRHATDLATVLTEIHNAGADGINVDPLINRCSHYHGIDSDQTTALVEELITSGKAERVKGLLRSTTYGWTLRSRLLRAMATPSPVWDVQSLMDTGINAVPKSVRRTLRELAADGLVELSGPKHDPTVTPLAEQSVSQADLARALRLSADTPISVMLAAVRDLQDNFAVLQSPYETDSMAAALNCNPAPESVLLAVAADRTARAAELTTIIESCREAIAACNLSEMDDHPSQVINQLQSRLMEIRRLADGGTVGER